MPSKKKSPPSRKAKGASKSTNRLKRETSPQRLRARDYTLAQSIALVREGGITQRQMAADLGVNVSTLRRWQYGKTHPNRKDERIAKAVKSIAVVVDAVKKDFIREQAAKKKKPTRAKRVKRIDPNDPKRKAKIDSDSIDIGIVGVSEAGINRVMRRYRDSANLRGVRSAYRFLVLFDDGAGDYPNEYAWLDWEGNLEDYDDEEIADAVLDAMDYGVLITIRIKDK